MRATDHDGGTTRSMWHDTSIRAYDTKPDLETDVCIVGAGIAGLTTAFELVRRGARVSVLDDGPIGGGETGRTSAHLASAVDDRFHILESRFGERGAHVVASSHAAAIDWIETTVQELAIDCDFERVNGYLFAGEPTRELEKELAAARKAGLDVDAVARAPLPFDTGPALRFARQAQFHPLRYLRGLAEAIVERGGHIHTGVHVEAIEPGRPLTIRIAGERRMLARMAVDATNGTFTSPLRLPIRQAAYRSYVLAFDLPPNTIERALYWDTEDPYHYIRIAPGEPDRDVLVVGGCDHRVGQGNEMEAWTVLEQWTRSHFPLAGARQHAWSGQIMEPADGPALIGRSPDLEHVYVVTGDSGNGLTHGTIAGILIPELMRGHDSPWAAVYDPARSRVHGLGTLIADAARSSAPYVDWLRGGDVDDLDHIPPGHGAVVRRGLHLIAAYRDDSGNCHMRSATCPHLKGAVRWNAGEKTWDCPCHGSRFDAYGRVLNGPAYTDLAPIEESSDAPVREPAREEPIEAPAIPLGPEDRSS